ncbi:M10 family metallopeptidase C-terminal domain-containing protein [Methylobacterium sp. P31]
MPSVGYLDLSGASATITFTQNASFGGIFNSLTLSDLYNQVPDITGVTLANNGGSASGLNESDITFDANDVTVSLLGTSFAAGTEVVLNFAFAPTQQAASGLAGNTGSSTGVVLYTPTANKALMGQSGDDVLIGRHNDTLTGNAGHDTFVFNPSFGNETVTDFKPGTDVVQFDHSLFANFDAVYAHAQQVGADTVIIYDANDTVTLKGVVLANLHASDFHFL